MFQGNEPKELPPYWVRVRVECLFVHVYVCIFLHVCTRRRVHGGVHGCMCVHAGVGARVSMRCMYMCACV